MARIKQYGRGGAAGMLLGQAGVHAVAAQLCLRGHNPSFPTVDAGVDLMMENGLRLQVKVAHLTFPVCGRNKSPNAGVRGGNGLGNYLGGCYIFNVRRGVWDKINNRNSRRYSRTYEDVADFFVLWGIDEDRFWIVPTSIKNRNIYFGRKDHPNNSNNVSYTSAFMAKRNADMEDRWDLLDVVGAANQIVDSVTMTFPAAGDYPVSIDVKEKI